jgi:crossover junction endodeoxyribonuclease RuvC
VLIVGVDPGKSGAVAAIESTGKYHSHFIGTDVHEFICYLQSIPSQSVVFIEKAQVYPRNGSVGMFNYGKGYGELIGVATALGFSLKLVPPQKWFKTLQIGKLMGIGKEGSIRAARSLHPSLDLRASDRCRTPHDGLADALLIAEYGRRQVYP